MIHNRSKSLQNKNVQDWERTKNKDPKVSPIGEYSPLELNSGPLTLDPSVKNYSPFGLNSGPLILDLLVQN